MSKHKIPFLLLHGALGSSASFDHLLSGWESKFDFIRPNLPGHAGEKFQEGIYSVNNLSTFLGDYIAKNQLESIRVFGYSLGGYLALYHESRFPGSFSRIVTLGTKLEWNEEFALKQEQQLNPETLKIGFKDYYEGLERIHGLATEELLFKVIHLMKELGTLPLIQQRSMEAIKIPLLLAVGDKDRMVTAEETIRYSGWCTSAESRCLLNTGHPLEKLRKEDFFSLIDF